VSPKKPSVYVAENKYLRDQVAALEKLIKEERRKNQSNLNSPVMLMEEGDLVNVQNVNQSMFEIRR